MPANNPTADLIMRLLREGNTRGLPMVESPELSQYLNQSYLSKRVQPRNEGNVVVPGADAFMPAGADMPPPISKDPWFDQGGAPSMDQIQGMSRLPPSAGLQDGEFRNDFIKGLSGPGSDTGNLFIWAEKNGQKFKLDGPFPDADSAALQLARLQKNIDPRSQMSLSLAPDIMDT